MHILTGPEPFDYQSFTREDTFAGLDRALPDLFEIRPDEEGRIEFKDIPRRGRLYLLTKSNGLGQGQWRNEDNVFASPIEIELAAESAVSGQILDPDGNPAVGMKVTARLEHGGRIDVAYLHSFRAETGKDGKFAIGGMPHTEFRLSVEDPTGQTTFRPLERQLAEPGEPMTVTLHMETGTIVTGRVLDPTGKPVEGAAISALADTDGGAGLDDDVSDYRGRFELRLPAGAAKLYFNALPDGFAYPRPQIVKRLDIEKGVAAIDDVDLYLERK